MQSFWRAVKTFRKLYNLQTERQPEWMCTGCSCCVMFLATVLFDSGLSSIKGPGFVKWTEMLSWR